MEIIWSDAVGQFCMDNGLLRSVKLCNVIVVCRGSCKPDAPIEAMSRDWTHVHVNLSYHKHVIKSSNISIYLGHAMYSVIPVRTEIIVPSWYQPQITLATALSQNKTFISSSSTDSTCFMQIYHHSSICRRFLQQLFYLRFTSAVTRVQVRIVFIEELLNQDSNKNSSILEITFGNVNKHSTNVGCNTYQSQQ